MTGGKDAAVVVWDLRSEQPGRPLPTAHSGPVNTVAFIGDEVASGGADGRVLRWSGDQVQVIRDAGPAVKSTLTGHAGPVNAVLFDADGDLTSFGPDPRVIRWELDPEQVISRLSAPGPR